jgi:hypothetical protein
MPGRPDEGEAAAQRRFDRGAGRERRRLVGRLARDRVGVDPGLACDPSYPRDVLGRVAQKELVLRRGAPLAPIAEMLQ